MSDFSGLEWSELVKDSVMDAVVVDEGFVEDVLAGILAKGHVLIEDDPGTGKTLTAKSIAESMGLSFNRIQFTPDLLPSDITGSHVYNEKEAVFEFKKGPIFSNVVLADEINRAPPKTQAALLEAMGEKQVTVDNETMDLPEPFFVIATQNPIEHKGTFELPEAQLDRFMIKSGIGYPSPDGEKKMLKKRSERNRQTPKAENVSRKEELIKARKQVEEVHVDEDVMQYIVDIGNGIREDDSVSVGLSPRGVQRLFEVSRAKAFLEGRDYVVPQDVKSMIDLTVNHRIELSSEAQMNEITKSDVVQDVKKQVNVPGTK